MVLWIYKTPSNLSTTTMTTTVKAVPIRPLTILITLSKIYVGKLISFWVKSSRLYASDYSVDAVYQESAVVVGAVGRQ